MPRVSGCQSAFIGEVSAFVDDRGSRTYTEAGHGATDFASDRFIECHGILKDESGADKTLKGGPNCSLANDKFEGGSNNHLIEDNTHKKVVGGGGVGKEVASLVVERGDLTVDSKDSRTTVQSVSGRDSIVAGRIVKGGARVQVREKNKRTTVVSP